jgi:hypothetical protein
MVFRQYLGGIMKRWVFVVLAALAITACASEPVYNPKRPIPVSAQGLGLDRIERAIIEGGQAKGWVFERIATGHLAATQRQPKYEAVVDIRFDPQAYEIVYRSSRGFREEPGTIHAHYNFWIRNLQNDIDARLSNLALQSG